MKFNRLGIQLPLCLAVCFAIVLVSPAFSQSSGAAGTPSWQIDGAESVFAVITHKDGVAARLAHNHIVTAQDVEATLHFDPSQPASVQFQFSAPVQALRIDAPEDQTRWYPAIERLGLLDEAFSEIAADKREDIHGTMTSRKQLDAEKHPTLGGRLVSEPVVDGGSFTADLELEVKGQKVTQAVEGSFSLEGDRLKIEASGAFAFTDFGIKPYSAMLGAVKNSDRFHVFLHLEATSATAGSDDNGDSDDAEEPEGGSL